jgi:hypothetical protein
MKGGFTGISRCLAQFNPGIIIQAIDEVGTRRGLASRAVATLFRLKFGIFSALLW